MGPKSKISHSESARLAGAAYAFFLDGCQPLPGKVLTLMKRSGISKQAISDAGLRYTPYDPQGLVGQIGRELGLRALVASGLLLPESTRPDLRDESDILPMEPGGRSSIFRPYDEGRVPYMIVPYVADHKLVYLRARPLLKPSKLDRLKLPRFIATSKMAPCLFNNDVIAASPRVLIFSSELDALVATSIGLPAVASTSLSQFRAAWARQFSGKSVWLMLDAGQKNDLSVNTVHSMFEAAGLLPPMGMYIPPREELASFLIDNFADFLPKASPLSDACMATGSLEAQDDATRFISAIPVGEKRMLVIHTVESHGQEMVRCRYWKQDAKGGWEKDDRMTFVIPQTRVDDFISGLMAASRGVQATPVPSVLRGLPGI